MNSHHRQQGTAEIIITPLDAVAREVAQHRRAWVCGLLSPEMADAHPVLPVPEERRLKLSMHDVNGPRGGYQAASARQVESLLDFARQWWRAAARGEAGPLVLHCWFGVSRSPAAAFILQCALRSDEGEMQLAQELRALAPFATPNARLVALADDLLGRGGRMQQAIRTIGRGAETSAGMPFHWPLGDTGRWA